MTQPEDRRVPVGTVTLLLADFEGSTRLWEADAGAMTGAIERLDESCRRHRDHYTVVAAGIRTRRSRLRCSCRLAPCKLT
jgi:hypothetical protein